MNLFGDSDYLEKLSLKGDPLERLEKVVDFECFRPTLNRIFKYDLKNKSHGGRPPYDLVLMLKILILQRLYNLSDDAMEYQMIDRISFRRFLKIDDKVPDAKTIWNFRNQLSKSNRGNWLFSAFQEKLESQGMIAHKGQIVDATFIEAPKQRNPKDENELIKANRVPVNWTKNKRAQKDTAARWTIKGNERHYGYKNHIAIDTKSKFVKNYQTTPANDPRLCSQLSHRVGSSHCRHTCAGLWFVLSPPQSPLPADWARRWYTNCQAPTQRHRLRESPRPPP